MTDNTARDTNATGRTYKKISSRTVQAINRLTAKQLESQGVIVSARNGGFICPFCQNGSGRDATGIEPSKKIEDWTAWQCFRCGKTFNNIQLLAQVYGMDTRADFVPLVEKICVDFDIAIEYDSFDTPTYKRTRNKKKTKDEPIDEAELALIRQDLSVSDEPLRTMLEFSPGKKFRGLPIEQWLKFGCRFISNWTPPSLRKVKQGTYGLETPRMLVPAGDTGYLARLTVPLKSFEMKIRGSVIEKMHAGTKQLFNSDVLPTAAQVFCFEGYLDAMSAELAGFAAVALGSADRGDLLVDAVAKMTQKPQIIILLDSDSTGRKAAPKLYNELIAVGCPCCVRFLSDDVSKLDCNDILATVGVDALRDKLQAILDDSLAELAAIEVELTARHEERLQDDDLNFYFDGDKSDLDFANRLERFCGNRIRWLTDSERWLIYGNGLWTRGSEKNSCISHFGLALADAMKNFAENEDERDLAATFKSAKKISSAITLLKGCDNVRITQADLDRHNNLLNVLNGVVNLQDGKLYPHDSSLMITQQCRADFAVKADTAFVQKFFSDIMPDEMTRRGLIRWLGYCLTGETCEEKFAVWTGQSGANGKGTLSATLLELLGTYATGLAPKALLKSYRPADANNATTALNALENTRFAISEEMPLDGELDTSLVKNLTGGDRINLRLNFKEYRTVRATSKINLSGNFAPRIENVHDGGILRRLLNFSFDVQFGTSDNPADPDLKKKMLTAENLRGLLALLVREAGSWYNGGLIISDGMKRATAQHLSQNDFVEEFLSDNYFFVPNASVKAKDFIDELRAEYPRECSRFKRADLIQLVANVHGVTYSEDRTRNRIFRGIGKAANDGDTPISPDDIPFD